MKKVMLGLGVLAALTACNARPTAPFMNQGAMPPVNQFRAANAGLEQHAPAFARKLQNPAQYRFEFGVSAQSICGQNDLQHVNSYDGSLGQPVEFVKAHERAVGALAMGSPESSRKFCSGTLISEDLFLTASHCIDGSITSKYAVFNYQTLPGSSELAPQEHFKIAEVVEDGSASRLDYAILRIEGNPGQKYGFNKIRVALPEDGHKLTIIQHPKGQPKQVEVGPKVAGSGVYMGYEDLDTEPGSSGSGVLDVTGMLVGVHTNGGCYSSGGANKGVKMTEIAKASKVVQSMAQQSESAQMQAFPQMQAFRR